MCPYYLFRAAAGPTRRVFFDATFPARAQYATAFSKVELPEDVAGAGNDFEAIENLRRLAFADQVEQKIIPKIRGIDLSTDNANECLSEVESIISELGDTELSNAFSTARSESRMVGTFQWRGVTRRAEEDQQRHVH